MTFTRDAINAAEVLACGLVCQVVADETLMEAAVAKAQRIAKNSPHALRMAKRLLCESQHLRLETVLEMSAAFQALAHPTTDHHERVAQAVKAMTKR